MHRVDSSSGSCSNSDIDLESGEMITTEEDARKGQDLSSTESSDNSMSCRISSKCMSLGSLSGSRSRSCSYDHKMSNSNEIYYKNKEMMQLAKFRQEMENSVDKATMIDTKKPKKARPPRPPRHPRGPSLGSSDIKMLREISKLNLKRRKMEHIKTLKKVEKKKASSLHSNLACFVTVIFFFVIILQGFLSWHI